MPDDLRHPNPRVHVAGEIGLAMADKEYRENALPAPVSIATRISGSASIVARASRNSDMSPGFSAFSFSGRFNVK